jgi:hypothetical protein
LVVAEASGPKKMTKMSPQNPYLTTLVPCGATNGATALIVVAGTASSRRRVGIAISTGMLLLPNVP